MYILISSNFRWLCYPESYQYDRLVNQEILGSIYENPVRSSTHAADDTCYVHNAKNDLAMLISLQIKHLPS